LEELEMVGVNCEPWMTRAADLRAAGRLWGEEEPRVEERERQVREMRLRGNKLVERTNK